MKFTEQDFNTLKGLLKLTQADLCAALYVLLQKYYEPTEVEIIKGNIIARGSIPVALIAHMDTVHPKPPTNIYFDRTKNVIWSPDGLGADDRAGVYGIIRILKQGFKPTVIFTCDEEMCCAGACELVTAMPQLPNVNYMIELDRAHDNDCVFYDVDNIDFINYIQTFGFSFAHGSYSDIRVLSHYWKLCSVNLSVGYENEHTHMEYLKVNSLLRTLDAVMLMLSEADTQQFDYSESSFTLGGQTKCYFCNTTFPSYQTDTISLANGVQHICDGCLTKYAENLNLCEQCMNLFIDLENTNICPRCAGGHRDYVIDEYDF